MNIETSAPGADAEMPMNREAVAPRSAMVTRSLDGPTSLGLVAATLIVLILLVLLAVAIEPPWNTLSLGAALALLIGATVVRAVPRAAQLSFFGAAIGITADSAWSSYNSEAPVTIATSLMGIAADLAEALGLIAADIGAEMDGQIANGVWAFLGTLSLFIVISFWVEHE